LDLAQQYVDHSLRANRRSDHLYHAYNILHLDQDSAQSVISMRCSKDRLPSFPLGYSTQRNPWRLLESLRTSALYQPETHSYILYPDRNLPGFLEKNCLTQDQVRSVALLQSLVEAQDRSILTADVNGFYHFSGHIRNIKDVNQALDTLKADSRYTNLVESDQASVRALFEETFHHNEFTGRSGTFFAYEGLGSVYWHMVAKLLLAAQDTALRFQNTPYGPALMERYLDIRQGLGFNKPPAELAPSQPILIHIRPKARGPNSPE
jgi:hypothetical protein